MTNDEEEPESDDIVSEYENSPEAELKEALQDENMPDSDADYQQGFGAYPEQAIKDSITKFYRHVMSILKPKQVVRAGNFSFKEKKNSLNYLDIADYNTLWKNETVANYFRNKATNLASVSMGYKGFMMTNIMTQRRIVSRQTTQGPKPITYGGNQQGGSKP